MNAANDVELEKIRKHNTKSYQSYKTDAHIIWFCHPLCIGLSIIMEDAAETFLEYFWMDRYALKVDSLILVNSALVCIFSLPQLISRMTAVFKYGKITDRLFKGVNAKNKCRAFSAMMYLLTLGLAGLTFATACCLRAGVNFYRAYAGIKPGVACYQLTELGTVVQTPFNSDCMEIVDYVIAVCSLVPVPVFLLVFGIVTCLISCCGKENNDSAVPV